MSSTKKNTGRVQIETVVEINGSERKVQLPFVMGVMSDLSGKPEEELPPLEERELLEIDAFNFDRYGVSVTFQS